MKLYELYLDYAQSQFEADEIPADWMTWLIDETGNHHNECLINNTPISKLYTTNENDCTCAHNNEDIT